MKMIGWELKSVARLQVKVYRRTDGQTDGQTDESWWHKLATFQVLAKTIKDTQSLTRRDVVIEPATLNLKGREKRRN